MSDAVPVDLVPPSGGHDAGSPLWWVAELEAEMNARSTLIGVQTDYFEGRHKLAFATSKYREAFASMLAAVSDNWFPLMINAWVERLRPNGFSFGEEDQRGDKDAWRIWQTNYLDADGKLGFREAGKHGESYLLIWPDDKPVGTFGRYFSRRSEQAAPKITLEHPSQMIVRREPGDRRRRAAALKRWRESDGTVFATLYLPNEIHRFQRTDSGFWTGRADAEETSKHNLGVVPVVPLVNDPQMVPCRPPMALCLQPHLVSDRAHVGLGRSDQVDFVSTVDQLNKFLADMLVASEFGAFGQRWATGLDVPTDPETGEPIQPFEAAIDRMWINPSKDPNAKFGEFKSTDLENYGKGIEGRIRSLGARSRTPVHYLLGEMVNASGDALKSAETGLASKVRDKQDDFGESLEEAIRIAFAWMGDDDRASSVSAEVHWAPSESRSESEYVDSLVKKLALGVPKEQLWRDYGYSDTQIEQFKEILQEEAERLGVYGPIPPPPGTQPTPEPEPVAGE